MRGEVAGQARKQATLPTPPGVEETGSSKKGISPALPEHYDKSHLASQTKQRRDRQRRHQKQLHTYAHLQQDIPANLLPLLQQVTYFKKWRVQDLQKRARLKELEAQGAVKMDVNTDFKARE